MVDWWWLIVAFISGIMFLIAVGVTLGVTLVCLGLASTPYNHYMEDSFDTIEDWPSHSAIN